MGCALFSGCELRRRLIYVVQACARNPVPPDCSIVLWGRRFGCTSPTRKRLGLKTHSGVAEGRYARVCAGGWLERPWQGLKYDDANGTLAKAMAAGLR